MWRERNFYRDVWKPTQAASGLGIRPHECRHSYVTHLRAAGVNDADLAEIAGHRVETMLTSYAHAVGRSNDRVRSAVEGGGKEQDTIRNGRSAFSSSEVGSLLSAGSGSRNGTTRKSGEMQSTELKKNLLRSLRSQGFEIASDGRISSSAPVDKNAVRRLHESSRNASIEKARGGLQRHEGRLLGRFANGSEVEPARISPLLLEIESGSEEELLFRYARLHWSIPISAGYGRRLRYLVIDENNERLIGIIGLGDPVFSIRPRDHWIGWDRLAKSDRLRHVMDAFVLGAVPPYSELLCGKLVAALATSTEVRTAFSRKYRNKDSLISSRSFDGRLALLTTTSALGRSSIYNRLKLDDRLLYQPIGFTAGSGEFHFSNGVYRDILDYATANLEPTAKNSRWGSGWRSRREVVRRTLRELGLQPDMVYHGIRRELYVAPLAANSREFLRGDHSRLRWYRTSADDLFAHFRSRWLLPRAERDLRFRAFEAESLRLWH